MKIKHIALLFGAICVLATEVLGTPKNVIITRHADKTPPEECLSLQGLERAAALSYYFSGTPTYNTPPIAHVFAAYSGGPLPYLRAKQTCSPTASHLHLPLITDFNPEQIKEIAHEILTNSKYNDSTILVCWEHHHIPALVIALGGEDPGKWDGDIFDQVYMLTYEGNNKPKFQQFLQKLMFGDRADFKDTPHPLPPIPLPCPTPTAENKS